MRPFILVAALLVSPAFAQTTFDELTQAANACGRHSRVVSSGASGTVLAYEAGWEKCESVMRQWRDASAERQRADQNALDIVNRVGQ